MRDSLGCLGVSVGKASDFSWGHDLRVLKSSPASAPFSANVWFLLSLCLYPSPTSPACVCVFKCTQTSPHSLSLSNKLIKSWGKKEMRNSLKQHNIVK